MSFYFQNKHKFTKQTTGELKYDMDINTITYSIKGHGFLDSIFLGTMSYRSIFYLYISVDGNEELLIHEEGYSNAVVKNLSLYRNYAGGNATIDYNEESIKDKLSLYTNTPVTSLLGVMPFYPFIFKQELKIRIKKTSYTGTSTNNTRFTINYFTLS